MPSTLCVGALFSRYTAVFTASPQNVAGMLMLFSRQRAISTIVWFLRSTTPFCCGVYGAVVKCLMPPSSQN